MSYVILGVSGLVIATVFAVVASLASRPANHVQPLPDLPGPAIGSSTEAVPAQEASSAATAISASPKATTTTPRTQPPATAPARPTTSTGQAAALPPQPPAAPGQNRQPLARFSVDCDGLLCRFDGSASSDADGQVIYFAWGFGERGEGDQGQGKARVQHQYGAPGFFTVTLVIMDNDGRIGQTTQQVTVTA